MALYPTTKGTVFRYRTTLNALIGRIETEHALHKMFTELILGCGVHGSRDAPPAQRSQLLKLRGTGIVEARMKLAGYLGVKVKAEAARVAAARTVVAAL